MSALIHHQARHDHLALVFAERERRGMWKPTAFTFPRGIEARSGETGTGSIRQDESPTRQGAATPSFFRSPTHG